MSASRKTILSLNVLASYLAASAATAMFGGYFTAKVTITVCYAALVRPAWAPPAWIFGPVWSLLYASMSLAMWLVWRAGRARPSGYDAARACWWGQLALNAAWPVLFWLQPAGVAPFLASTALTACVWLCLARFWRLSKAAALLMLPYAAWVSFATVLSLALWRMNSPGAACP